MRIRLLTLFFLSICIISSSGQVLVDKKEFILSYLGSPEGLDNQYIYSILEAKDGAIWFSSKNSVVRYNGQSTKEYPLKASSNIFSNSSGRTTKLLKEPNGEILAFDNKGIIFKYDPANDRFIEKYNLGNDWKEGGEIILNDIFIDTSKRLWLGLSNGLFIMSPKGRLRKVIINEYINHLCQLNGEVIVSTTKGVISVDTSNFKQRSVVNSINVQTAYFDQRTKYLWLGTFNEGIKVINTNTWDSISIPSLNIIPHTPIRSIELLNDSMMLFGVDGSGVFVTTRRGQKAKLLFNADDKTGNVLHSNGIYDIFRDHRNNIWIGSYSGGVDVAYPTGNLVEYVQHEHLNSQSLVNNNVNAVLQTSNELIWFATDRGVSIYNKKTESWISTLSNKVVLTLCEGGKGEVLAGTYGNGVFTIDKNGKAHLKYTAGDGLLKTNYVYSLKVDSQKNLWIGCLDGPLIQVGKNSTHYYNIQVVQCIKEIPDGRIAIGTANGFYAINPETHKATHYFTAQDFLNADVNCYIQDMYFESGNKVWLATDGGGIYIYDMQNKNIRNLTKANGLPSNTIYALGIDKQRRFVASTDRGLALIDPHNSLHISNLNFVKGLDLEYKRNSTANLSDGRIIFGSSKGAIFIDTYLINQLDYSASLRLNRVRLIGSKRSMTDKMQSDLYKMLHKGYVKLAHTQNTFSIDYECINYQYQHDIYYQYMLKGFDPEWNAPTSNQSIQYTNIPSGKYKFVIRSLSRNNNQVLDKKELTIVIAQPWWNTWIARFFYLILFLFVIYLIWKYYRNRLEQKYFYEKIDFFVHTTHEIRTPLSLIMAPLENIAEDKTLSNKSRQYLKIALNNGNLLHNTVSLLLNFQKSDREGRCLNICEINLKIFLEAQKEKFSLLARQKQIELTILECPSQKSIWMDSAMADKIFENLLSNAIKYTPEGGSVYIKAWEVHELIFIEVCDNGIGIPKKEQKHIFHSFYRAKNAVNTKETGSGLGLLLTQRLVKLHRGKLSFYSKEGYGTTFQLVLRAGCSHLSEHIRSGANSQNIGHQPLDSLFPLLPNTTTSTLSNKNSRDTLLFVDDNDDLRNFIRMAFESDFKVITKNSSEEALKYLENGGICDIIVSDIMMPGMQGDELCHHIKANENTAWIPVILLTAKSDRNFIIEGLNRGADDYITKPFDTAILKTKIEGLLANRRRLSEYYLNRSIALANNFNPSKEYAKEEEFTKISENTDYQDQIFIEKATLVVINNLSDPNFCIDKLCREMAMSRTLLYGRLKTLTSQSPHDFIQFIRMERAATLIREGKSVLDASVLTGFVNAKYFSTIFKKHFGTSPSKFI